MMSALLRGVATQEQTTVFFFGRGGKSKVRGRKLPRGSLHSQHRDNQSARQRCTLQARVDQGGRSQALRGGLCRIASASLVSSPEDVPAACIPGQDCPCQGAADTVARCTYIVFCIPHDFWDSKRQLSRRDSVKSRPRAHLRGEHLDDLLFR